jgi:hypothetical protein
VFSGLAPVLAARRETRDEAAMRPSPAQLLLLVIALTACGGAPPPAPEAPPAPGSSTAAPSAPAKPAGDDPAARAAAIDALTAGEAKSGTCDEGHQAALEKLLAGVEKALAAKNGEDGKPVGLQLVGKRIVALGSAAKSIEMAVTGRGTEVHVLAFGAKDVSLDVLVGNAAATTLRSPFQRSEPLALDLPKIGTVSDVQSDSRQVQIKPGQPIVVKLSGQGCAALISLLKP